MIGAMIGGGLAWKPVKDRNWRNANRKRSRRKTTRRRTPGYVVTVTMTNGQRYHYRFPTPAAANRYAASLRRMR